MGRIKNLPLLFLLIFSLLLVACGDTATAVVPTATTAPATTAPTTTVPTTVAPTTTASPTTPAATTTLAATTSVPPSTIAATAAPSLTPVPTPAPIARPGLTIEPGSSSVLTPQQTALLPAFRDDMKLPQNINAPVYNISLDLKYEAGGPKATGKQSLAYKNDTGAALDSLVFWLYPQQVASSARPFMSISNVKINEQATLFKLENSNAQIRVPLSKILDPGASVKVDMDFKLDFLVDGSYDYFRYDSARAITVLTYWYPQIAVWSEEYNGWDNHAYNALGDITNSRVSYFNVLLTAPTEQVLATSGHVIDTLDNADKTRTYRIVTGPVRDVMASFSPRYQSVTGKSGDTTVTSYFTERDRVLGEKSLQIAVDAIKVYSELFGTYPYTEFKVIEAPLEGWGGYEYPSGVIITARYYESNAVAQLEYALVHEIVHQWWYGLVGSDQTKRAWQDESLTQYSPVLYYERYKGQAEAQRILDGYMKSGYNNAVSTGQDGIVDQPVSAFKSAGQYVALVYNKGGLFYDVYRTAFGDEAFLKFARSYFQENRYKYVGSEALTRALVVGAGADKENQVRALYNKWIKSKDGQ